MSQIFAALPTFGDFFTALTYMTCMTLIGKGRVYFFKAFSLASQNSLKSISLAGEAISF
jgi:hypothetical protein